MATQNTLASTQPKFQKPKKIAILGDGFSRGEWAHPELNYFSKTLIDILGGKKQLRPEQYLKTLQANSEKPKQTWLSYRSFQNPLVWVVRNLWAAFARISTEEPRMSWAYQTVQSLGLKASDLTIAAQKHGTIDELHSQYEQVLVENKDQYVDTYFIALAGADLCQGDHTYISSSGQLSKKLGNS